MSLIIAVKTDTCIYVGVDSRVTITSIDTRTKKSTETIKDGQKKYFIGNGYGCFVAELFIDEALTIAYDAAKTSTHYYEWIGKVKDELAHYIALYFKKMIGQGVYKFNNNADVIFSSIIFFGQSSKGIQLYRTDFRYRTDELGVGRVHHKTDEFKVALAGRTDNLMHLVNNPDEFGEDPVETIRRIITEKAQSDNSVGGEIVIFKLDKEGISKI